MSMNRTWPISSFTSEETWSATWMGIVEDRQRKLYFIFGVRKKRQFSPVH